MRMADPDKMNIMLYALGKEIFLDPGRLTYRCPEHTSWSRQTVAHNTVVVNQQSQLPEAGELLLFEQRPGCDVVVAEAAKAVRGARLRRALVLFDHALVDMFHVIADEEATFDWTLHGSASLKTGAELVPLATPIHDSAGYQHLSDLRRGDVTGQQAVDWAVGADRFLRTHLTFDGQAELFSGNGIGYQLSAKAPFILLRQRGTAAWIAVVHDLSGNGGAVADIRSEVDADELRVSVRIDDRVFRVAWDCVGAGRRVDVSAP